MDTMQLPEMPATEPQTTDDAPINPNLRLFTSANAREMNARSHAAKRAKARDAAQPPPETPQAPSTDAFVSRRLARVRALLDDIDDQLAKARDPLDRERLARAANVLSEQERILDGRPLPGARKPGPLKQLRDVPLAPIG